MGFFTRATTGGRLTRPHDGRYAERRRLGMLLAGGAAALALALILAPAAPSFAEDASDGAPVAAAPAAQPSPATTGDVAAAAATTPGGAPAAGEAKAEASSTAAAESPVADASTSERPPALTVPDATDPMPADAGASATPTATPSPDAAADGAAEAFVTVLYRTSPGTAGTVRPHEERVRAADGAGLSGSTATPLKNYVCIGWYNGDRQVSADATLSRDEALAGANHAADGSLAATTFIARFARPAASLHLTVTLASEPANGSCFTEGESVTFRVTASNTGNVPLANVSFDSDLGTFDPLATLAVGQSRSSEWTHVVTADDVRSDVLACTVSAHGTAPGYNLEAEAGPESAVAQTGVLAAGRTYVLYGAYPADGGSVSRSLSIVEARSGEGLEAVVAEPQPGYVFAGWYEDDERISTDATLAPETAREFLNHGRAAYAPTLFLAHFVREEPKPDTPDGPSTPGEPDQPDTPDTPVVPGGDEPVTPDVPDDPDKPATPDDPGEATTPDDPDATVPEQGHAGSDADEPAATAPSGANATSGSADATASSPADAKAAPAASAPAIPQSGDSAPALAALLLVIALASGAIALRARRHGA